ncbi:MAG TPA: hypothetical protein DCG48_04475 [Rhodospirillaceae bacterium]|nr:hypothetical protein [Rhodospirillaceae bacterium]|tara:strand:+ start:4030 stop:4233 length:204 start_codon:yes stop_codon:yes gene_type:complete
MSAAQIGDFRVAATIRRLFQETQSRKAFICPGCNRTYRGFPGKPSPCCGGDVYQVTKTPLPREGDDG